jgi:hypothetical protein
MAADPADVVFWLCAALNMVIAVALVLRFRARVTAGMLAERKAKGTYTWLCLASGALCGSAVFLSITSLFDISRGHGEIIIAAALFNVLLSLVLIVSGRIVIGWEPIKW